MEEQEIHFYYVKQLKFGISVKIKKKIIPKSNVCRTLKTSIQKPQFENQSFDSNFIKRHSFLCAEQREPSLKATKKSARLLVTGENTTLSKVTSIFMQYCEKVKVLFPPTQNHYQPGSPTLHKSQEAHMLNPQLVQGIKQSRASSFFQ